MRISPEQELARSGRDGCLIDARRALDAASSSIDPMNGWRFADRGWFVNDALNLRSAASRAIVAAELKFPNVTFGVHRLFAGGGSPSEIAIATIDQWETELSRGRPGDNLILLSLRQVQDQALVHVGDVASPDPPVLHPMDVDVVEAYISGGGSELAFVWRFTATPGAMDCASAAIDLHDNQIVWRESVAERSAGRGEVWLFDGEILWRDHDRRQFGWEPPEAWTAHHGIYLVDGYLPDEQGRVVCGGPY